MRNEDFMTGSLMASVSMARRSLHHDSPDGTCQGAPEISMPCGNGDAVCRMRGLGETASVCGTARGQWDCDGIEQFAGYSDRSAKGKEWAREFTFRARTNDGGDHIVNGERETQRLAMVS